MSDVPPNAREALKALGIVSRETLRAFEAHIDLLEKWQPKINLVSGASLKDAWMRHVVDSAQLWPLLPEGAKVLTDFGSGGGFPGLTLAILGRERPGFAAHLIESDKRKAAFLREAARATGAPVTVHDARVEALRPWPSDIITARALAPLRELLALAAPFVTDGTMALFPKGKTGDQELTDARGWGRFEAESFPSHTDGEARIFRLSGLISGT